MPISYTALFECASHITESKKQPKRVQICIQMHWSYSKSDLPEKGEMWAGLLPYSLPLTSHYTQNTQLQEMQHLTSKMFENGNVFSPYWVEYIIDEETQNMYQEYMFLIFFDLNKCFDLNEEVHTVK